MSFPRWIHRVVLAGLLMAAYLWAWTPARTAWIEHGAGPLLDAVAPPTAEVTPRPDVQTAHVVSADGRGATYRAPAGVKFLLPGLVLILLAPHRPRLGLFFAGHLSLSALILGLYMVGLAGLPGGLLVGDFVQGYLVDAYSLAVPVFVFVRTRSGSGRGEGHPDERTAPMMES